MKHTHFILATVVAIAWAGSASYGYIIFPAPDIATPGLQPKPPDYVITQPPGVVMHDAVFAPDGKNVIVLVDGEAVNVWAAIVYVWPEMLEIVLLLLSAWQIRRIWRIARRDVPIGHPYCRHCGYCLTGCPSERCPECGTMLTAANRRIARPRQATLGRVAIITILIAVGCELYLSDWPVRYGSVSEWRHWYSPSMAKWKTRRLGDWPWILSESMLRAVEVDPASGKTLRVLHERPYQPFVIQSSGAASWRTKLIRRQWFPHIGPPRTVRFIRSDDSSSVGLDFSDRIVVFDLNQGSTIGEFDAPWSLTRWLSDHGRTLYSYRPISDSQDQTRLHMWDVATGKRCVAPFTRRTVRQTLLSQPPSSQPKSVLEGRIEVWDVYGREVRRAVEGQRYAQVDQSGRWVCVTADHAVLVMDAANGRWQERLALAGKGQWNDFYDEPPTISAASGCVLAIDHGGTYLSVHRNVLTK